MQDISSSGPFAPVTIPDVIYKTVDNIPLYLDIIRPDPQPAGPLPVVMYVHGGGWEAGHRKGGDNVFLAANGFFTISIEYRLSGQAIFPAQIEDVQDAVRWARVHAEEYHLDADHIGAWGHSAGGHLVALLGTAADAPELVGEKQPEYSSRVQAVVDLSGPTDLTRMEGWHLLPDSPEAKLLGGPIHERIALATLANPLKYVQRNVPPFLIIHGINDDVVPVSQSEILFSALKEVGVDATFVPLAEDHVFGVQAEESWSTIQRLTLEFFNKHLRIRE